MPKKYNRFLNESLGRTRKLVFENKDVGINENLITSEIERIKKIRSEEYQLSVSPKIRSSRIFYTLI